MAYVLHRDVRLSSQNAHNKAIFAAKHNAVQILVQTILAHKENFADRLMVNVPSLVRASNARKVSVVSMEVALQNLVHAQERLVHKTNTATTAIV